MNNLILQIKHLTVLLSNKPILVDINLNIRKGMLIAIAGPNGAGKSTLLKSILGLTKIYEGKIKPYYEKFSYIPQKDSVDWDFPITVLEVVLMGRQQRKNFFYKPTALDKQKAFEALETVHMSSFTNRHIKELSGGQQQRVFIARALVQEANIYFMDEPFKGIDITTEKILFQLFRKMSQQGKTILVVHHNLNTLSKYFDKVIFLNKKIIAFGNVKKIFTSENIEKTYK